MDSQAHPLPHGLLWSSPLYSVRFPHDIPFFAPLACWWTLIVVLSSISVVSSTKSCSIRAMRIFSHTPAFVQARNRLYTLCHGPNRSDKSRHGIPVFSQYRIALSISRLLFPGLASLRLFFRWKLFFEPVPLFFTYFVSFHVFHFIIFALYTQYLSFKTDSRPR